MASIATAGIIGGGVARSATSGILATEALMAE